MCILLYYWANKMMMMMMKRDEIGENWKHKYNNFNSIQFRNLMNQNNRK